MRGPAKTWGRRRPPASPRPTRAIAESLLEQLDRHADPAVTDRLLCAAGNGDQMAFRALLDRTAHIIFGCLHRALPDPCEAGRAAEAVYVRLWRIAPRLSAGACSAHDQLEMLVRRELIRPTHGMPGAS